MVFVFPVLEFRDLLKHSCIRSSGSDLNKDFNTENCGNVAGQFCEMETFGNIIYWAPCRQPRDSGNCCGESPERQQRIIFPYIISQKIPVSFSPPFASDVSHQRTDWISIHGHICHLLIPVLGPQPCFHSEKDRKHGKEQLLRRQVGAGG